MVATTKELAPLSSATQGNASTAQKSGATSQTDAIGVEIPVVVHASRYSLSGQDASKVLLPLHEQTHTVVVFPQGGVVRLSASLPVGELVVLTNQQTGADILCRVTNSKSQQGIHNYVDLEFTQHVPDFWRDGLVADRSSSVAKPASLSAAPALGTVPAMPAPVHQPVPLSLPKADYPSPVPATISVPDLAPPAIPVSAAADQSPVPSAARAATASPAPSGQTGQLTAPEVHGSLAERTSTSLNKGLWAAAVVIVAAGLTAGVFLLGRSGSSASPSAPAAKVLVAPPSLPARPVSVPPAGAPPVRAIAKSTARSSAVVPPPARPVEALDVPQPAELKSDGSSHPQPTRRDIPIGKLAAPIAKRPAIAGSVEPPPALVTQGNAEAASMLGSSLLASGPGGQLQEPRLIASSAPIYPVFARTTNLEGVVVMDILVDPTGKVAQVKVVSGPVPLRQAAMDAIRQWKYQPAQLNGNPIEFHTNANVNFALR